MLDRDANGLNSLELSRRSCGEELFYDGRAAVKLEYQKPVRKNRGFGMHLTTCQEQADDVQVMYAPESQAVQEILMVFGNPNRASLENISVDDIPQLRGKSKQRRLHLVALAPTETHQL